MNGMSGSQVRLARKSFDPKVYTRRSADLLVSETSDTNLIERFMKEHANKHVRRHAGMRLEALEAIKNQVVEPIVEATPEPVLSELEQLVVRFTAEGKPSPEKSARASLAAKAQAAKRRAKAEQTV